jgi:hypothetical protein
MAHVIVRHPKTGMEYGIERADFKRRKLYFDPVKQELMTYEAAGFEIVTNIDGTELDEPKTEPEKK